MLYYKAYIRHGTKYVTDTKKEKTNKKQMKVVGSFYI